MKWHPLSHGNGTFTFFSEAESFRVLRVTVVWCFVESDINNNKNITAYRCNWIKISNTSVYGCCFHRRPVSKRESLQMFGIHVHNSSKRIRPAFEARHVSKYFGTALYFQKISVICLSRLPVFWICRCFGFGLCTFSDAWWSPITARRLLWEYSNSRTANLPTWNTAPDLWCVCYRFKCAWSCCSSFRERGEECLNSD